MIALLEFEECKKNPVIWYLKKKNLLHFFKWWHAFNKMNRFSINKYMIHWFYKVEYGFKLKKWRFRCRKSRNLFVSGNFYYTYCLFRNRLIPYFQINTETVMLLYVLGERFLRERNTYFTDMDNLSRISTVKPVERESFRYAYANRKELTVQLMFFEYFYRFAIKNGKFERFKCFIQQGCDSLKFFFRGYFSTRKRKFNFCILLSFLSEWCISRFRFWLSSFSRSVLLEDGKHRKARIFCDHMRWLSG